MSETFRTLLSDPLTYVVLIGIGWLARVYIERRITSGVDARFAMQLESHKQALHVATEQAKFDYQRRLAGFNLYAAKKYAGAAEVYAAIRIAHGHIYRLQGVREELSFKEYNVEDIQAYMTDHEIPRGKQEEILDLWKREKPEAIRRLRPYLHMLELQTAEQKAFEAQNAAFLNELYFSDRVIEASNDLFRIFRQWITYFKLPPQPGEKVARPSEKELDAALERVHAVLRDELADGAVAAGGEQRRPDGP